MKKQILIINTGGTLSSILHERGRAPGLTTDEMVEELRIVSGGADLVMMDVLSVDSANIFPEDWSLLARLIAEKKDSCSGIVVLHGTDTLAYTASALSFMLQNIRIPVVLTGSQLSIADPIADAMENCRCAISMAASGIGGIFIAFNRKVMLGCRASKTRTISFDAFESINYPNIAEISSLGMAIRSELVPAKRGVFSLQADMSDKVTLFKLYPGFDPTLLHAAASAGYRAIYLEAFGLGGIPFMKADLVGAIREITGQGVTVLVGTQCRYEGSNLTVYETGRRALAAGALEAFDMTTEAALTKLMWVLAQSEDPVVIREYFSLSLCGEVTLME